MCVCVCVCPSFKCILSFTGGCVTGVLHLSQRTLKLAPGRTWHLIFNLVLFTPVHGCWRGSRLNDRANLLSDGGVEAQQGLQVLGQDVGSIAIPKAASWQCLAPELGSFRNRTHNGQHLFAGQRAALITSPADVGPSPLMGQCRV